MGGGNPISAISDELSRFERNVIRPIVKVVANPISLIAMAVLGPVGLLIGASATQEQEQAPAVDQAVADTQAQVNDTSVAQGETDAALEEAKAAQAAAEEAAKQAQDEAGAAGKAAEAQTVASEVTQSIPSPQPIMQPQSGFIAPPPQQPTFQPTPAGPAPQGPPPSSWAPSGGSAPQGGAIWSGQTQATEFYAPTEMAQMEAVMPTVQEQVPSDQMQQFPDKGVQMQQPPQQWQPAELQQEPMITEQFGPSSTGTMDNLPPIAEEFTQMQGSPFGNDNSYSLRMTQARKFADVDPIAPDFHIKEIFTRPTVEEPRRVMMYSDKPIKEQYQRELLPIMRVHMKKSKLLAPRFMPLPSSSLPEYGEIETPGYMPTHMGFGAAMERTNPMDYPNKNLANTQPINGSFEKPIGPSSVEKALRHFRRLEDEYNLLDKNLTFSLNQKLKIRGIDPRKELNPIIKKSDQIIHDLNKMEGHIKAGHIRPQFPSDEKNFAYISGGLPALRKAVLGMRQEISNRINQG